MAAPLDTSHMNIFANNNHLLGIFGVGTTVRIYQLLESRGSVLWHNDLHSVISLAIYMPITHLSHAVLDKIHFLEFFCHISIEINECETANGGCEHICTDTFGSFICSCATGYQLDGNGLNCNGESSWINILFHIMTYSIKISVLFYIVLVLNYRYWWV